MKIKVIMLVALFFLTLSCAKKAKEEPTQELVVDSTEGVVNDEHNAKNSLDYIGMYKGILPCADCEGIETFLSLEDDKNYILNTKYLGKKESVSNEVRGTYSWNNEGNTIILSGNENAPTQYFVGENRLTQLDMEGSKIMGNLAEKYVLQKQNSINSTIPPPSAPVKANINQSSQSGKATKQETKEVFTISSTKWKLIELNGKPLKNSNQASNDLFLQLNMDNRYAAFAGCNRMMGGFELKEELSRIKFTKGASTMMACPDMTTEQEFSKMLETVDNYSINGNQMTLNKARMAPLARFQAMK